MSVSKARAARTARSDSQFNVRITAEEREAIRDLAYCLRRSKVSILREALAQFIAANTPKARKAGGAR